MHISFNNVLGNKVHRFCNGTLLGKKRKNPKKTPYMTTVTTDLVKLIYCTVLLQHNIHFTHTTKILFCHVVENSNSVASELIRTSTPLHEAAKSGNTQQTLELLEQGLDPCIVDERGRTPYMLANDKEVRNTFRRFIALNLDKWD